MMPSPVCARSGEKNGEKNKMPVSETVPAKDVAMMALIGRRMACSWQGPMKEQAAAGGVPRAMAGRALRKLTLRLDYSDPPRHAFYIPMVRPVVHRDR